MGILVNLLRWKKSLILLDENDKPIKDAKGKDVKVWLRVIGDEDQQEAYKMARIKSADKRAALRDINSSDYKDQVMIIADTDADTCKELIRISRGSNFTGEALSNVERPDLPKLNQIAVDADAPNLEEQEELDRLIEKVEKEYQEGIDAYVRARGEELDTELKTMTLDELRVTAMYETSNALSLNVFLLTVQDEKAWRSTYMDEGCSIRAYDSIDEFRQQHSLIRKQILEAYADLEMPPEDIKN